MYRLVAIIMMIVGGAAYSPVRAQEAPLSAADIGKIKTDVNAAFHAYVRAISARDARTISKDVFAHPGVTLDQDGVRLQTEEDTTKRYNEVFKGLEKTQYDHTDIKNPTVCVLNANNAIASGRLLRMNKDGSVLRDVYFSYLFMKMTGGWKLVTAFSIQKDKFVTCD